MFRQVTRARRLFSKDGLALRKADEINPLTIAVSKRPLSEKVRTSVSRLTVAERAIYDSVQEAIDALRRGADIGFVRRLISEGVDKVLNGFSVTQFISELEPMVRSIEREVLRSGGLHASQLPDPIGVKLRFDYLDPRAVAWANERSAELITAIVDEQRSMLRDIISEGVSEQLTVDEIGRNVRDVIGLPESWANAVPNARAAEFAKLISSGKSIRDANARADQVADRYRERLIRARAKTIARTEIMTAQNQGRFLSWTQGVEQGFIPKDARKEWIAAPGFGPKPFLCEICKGLSGIQVEWDKNFPGTDVLMPPLHPNCRCTSVIVPFEIKALEQAIAIPDSDYQLAQNYIEDLEEDELSITQDVKDLAQGMGGEPVGLENRFKSRNSLARKATKDVAEDRANGGNLSFRQALENNKDTLRYTISLPSSQYADGVKQQLLRLQASGVEFKSKIRWSRPDTYQGVNLQIRDPKTRRWHELQFHTPESLVTAKKNHPIFEKQRRMSPIDEDYDELTQKMTDIVGASPVPPNITKIIGLIL